jgi:biotin carboxylase
MQEPGAGDAARSRRRLDVFAVVAAGIRCTRFVGDDQEMSAEELVAELGVPMVVKPRIGMGGRPSPAVAGRSPAQRHSTRARGAERAR